MKISDRLRTEASDIVEREIECIPLAPLLNASADQIDRLESQLEEARSELNRMKARRGLIKRLFRV